MFLKSAKLFLMTVLFLFLALTAWLARELYHPFRGNGESTFFEAEKGQGAGAIAQGLKARGIIKNSLALRVAYRFYYSEEKLKAGEYEFSFPTSAKEALFKILRGEIFLHPFTVPEGLTGAEIGAVIEGAFSENGAAFSEAFLDTRLVEEWDPLATNLEGYLYPDTYHISLSTTVRDLVASMVAEFWDVFAESHRKRAEEIGMSIRDVVTLASLIEKETARSDEKPLVSAVFHNRLRIGMKLDCDPTIIYALKLEGNPTKRLRTRDLKNPSPYNTYLHAGLPPGPICNPGQESIEAALHPAAEDFLYFVSRNDGSHQFSRTYREHVNAVNKYQLKK